MPKLEEVKPQITQQPQQQKLAQFQDKACARARRSNDIAPQRGARSFDPRAGGDSGKRPSGPLFFVSLPDTASAAHRASRSAPMRLCPRRNHGFLPASPSPPMHLARRRFKDAMLPPVLSTPVMIMAMENAARGHQALPRARRKRGGQPRGCAAPGSHARRPPGHCLGRSDRGRRPAHQLPRECKRWRRRNRRAGTHERVAHRRGEVLLRNWPPKGWSH